jgi:hypothetical protein
VDLGGDGLKFIRRIWGGELVIQQGGIFTSDDKTNSIICLLSSTVINETRRRVIEVTMSPMTSTQVSSDPRLFIKERSN